jgi:hypothetical protein
LLKGSYQCHQKLIWFYIRKIDYGGDFLDKATYVVSFAEAQNFNKVLIKDMYENVVTNVRTSDGDTNDFLINIGLH